MNQILVTRIINKCQKLKLFKTILTMSIFSLSFFTLLYLTYKLKLRNEKIISENVSKNYNIYKLFANQERSLTHINSSDILCTISIPTLNISYPVFSGINIDLLKISPCRFFGDMPYTKNNLCIAGHNYDNDRFFSNINLLQNNDLIIIEDSKNNRFDYFVFEKFEINENEISSIMQYPSDYYNLTIMTCNNSNNKRLVINAKTKSP